MFLNLMEKLIFIVKIPHMPIKSVLILILIRVINLKITIFNIILMKLKNQYNGCRGFLRRYVSFAHKNDLYFFNLANECNELALES